MVNNLMQARWRRTRQTQVGRPGIRQIMVLSVFCQIALPAWGGQSDHAPLSFLEYLGSMVQDGDDWIDPLSIHKQDLLASAQGDGVEQPKYEKADETGEASEVEHDVLVRNEANDEH